MIKSGGYQTGRSYQFYRGMGHNPISALFMHYSDMLLWISLAGLGAIVGIMLEMVLR